MTPSVKNTSTAAAMQSRRSAEKQPADETTAAPDQIYRGVTPAALASAGQAIPPATGNAEIFVEVMPLTGDQSDAPQPRGLPFRIVASANGVSDYSILTSGSFESGKILTPGVDDMIHTLGVISQKMASAVSNADRPRVTAAPKQAPHYDADAAEILSRVSAIRTRHQLAVQPLSPTQSGLGFTLSLFR